jgi:hypothetical protein
VKRISYAEDHVVTGDAIADAVMAYAQALAMCGRSDTIDLPGLDAHGVRRRFRILVGPASQMLTSDVRPEDDDAGDGDITDDALVDDLLARTRDVAGASPQPVAVGDEVVVDLDGEQFRPAQFDEDALGA